METPPDLPKGEEMLASSLFGRVSPPSEGLGDGGTISPPSEGPGEAVYSLTMAKVGEVMTSSTPSSSQMALMKVVFPAPILP